MAFGIPTPAEIKDLEDHIIDRVKNEVIPEVINQLWAKLTKTTISFAEKQDAPKP